LGQIVFTTTANLQSATPDLTPAFLSARIDQRWGFTLFDYSEVTITNTLVSTTIGHATFSFEWECIGGPGSGVSQGYFDSTGNPDFTAPHSIRLSPGTYFITFKAEVRGDTEGAAELTYNGGVRFNHTTCAADFNGDGIVDFFDMLDFVDAFSRYGDDATFSNQWKLSGQADINGDGVVDFFDYLDFVNAFSAGQTSADFNADGTLDFFDYLDFVAAFSLGC
jgi:hypothetical protein